MALYCAERSGVGWWMMGEGGTYHSLIDRRPHPVIILTMQHHLRDLKSREIRQPQPDKLPSLVQLVQFLQRLGERRRAVRGVQVENVNTVRPQFGERGVEFLFDDGGGVGACFVRVPFCGTGEAAGFPVCGARPGFLLASYIDAGGVDFVVACCLEAVEDAVVGF